MAVGIARINRIRKTDLPAVQIKKMAYQLANNNTLPISSSASASPSGGISSGGIATGSNSSVGINALAYGVTGGSGTASGTPTLTNIPTSILIGTVATDTIVFSNGVTTGIGTISAISGTNVLTVSGLGGVAPSSGDTFTTNAAGVGTVLTPTERLTLRGDGGIYVKDDAIDNELRLRFEPINSLEFWLGA
jgi:hypothetical protein